jgi:hypothetical protein
MQKKFYDIQVIYAEKELDRLNSRAKNSVETLLPKIPHTDDAQS